MDEMSPRFQELWEQCKTTGVHPEFGKYVAWNKQKFAESIVRESIEVMKRHDYHGEWLGEKIREHFGLR